MSIAWTTVEKAFQDWVQAASGLADSKVIWAGQSNARPSGTFITLRITSLKRVGADWLQVFEAASPVDGAEIEHRVRGMRDGMLSMQCFGGTAAGATSPMAILNAVVSKATLQSRRDALNTAGIGLSTFGAVQGIDGLVGVSTFEPRALVDVRFFLAEEVVETSTYIETVQIENETTGDEFVAEIGA